MVYNCLECKKNYSSYKSLWNHNKKYHNLIIPQKIEEHPQKKEEKTVKMNKNLIIEIYICHFCNKKISRQDNLKRHEKKCKEKHSILKLEEQNKKIVEEIIKIKKEFKELAKTTTSQQVINVNGNINTAYNINSLGYEKYKGKLTETDKLNLLTGLRHQELPIVELVKKIYNEDSLVENRNTIITNLRSKDCLVYNSYTNKFEATNKSNHIDDIIKNRKDDLASMYKEFEGTTKLKVFERRVIEEYLEKIEGINKKDKKLKALYEKHKEEIIYIIYNCKEFMESIKDHLSELVDTIEV